MSAGERVAVLDREGLHIEGYDAQPSAPWARRASLDLLLRTCRDRAITQLWIHESAECEVEEWSDAIAHGWRLPEKPQPWQNTWQPGTYGRVALALPALEMRTTWSAAKTGTELLNAILAFRRAVGIWYRSSPGATGQQVMRESVKRLDLGASLAGVEMPEPARRGNTEDDFFWMRPLAAEERGMRYVHAFDKNAMYLSATRGAKLGFGRPEHVVAPGYFTAEQVSQPGYWLADVGCEFGELPPLARSGWLTTPSLHAARGAQIPMHIQEGWVYPDVHEALTPWAKRLYAAREALRATSPVAYGVLKSCYSQAIGWLGLNKLADSEEPNDLYRPDWRHTIIARARSSMYRDAMRMYERSDMAPFAIATDCLYYATDTSADETASLLGIRLGDAVGEYKHANSTTVEDVRECIALGGARGLTALQKRLKGTEDAQ